MKEFSVMKAAAAVAADFVFPLYASPKIDGFRGYILDKRLRARSNKLVANIATDKFFSHAALNGFDGELVVGNPAAKDVFQVTTSALRTERGDPKAVLLVFDCIDSTMGFKDRMAKVELMLAAMPAQFAGRVVQLTQVIVNNIGELLAFEELCLSLGFEGVMLRKPTGRYKQGRSTINEGGMLKFKRFVDAEAIIIGSEEEVEGDTLRPKGTLGSLVVRDIATGIEFNVGTGFSAKQRAEMWVRREQLKGEIVKYKSFPIGVVTKPRFPAFIGLRAPEDM